MNAIITSKLEGTPAMQEFNVSNHLLGDRAALDAAWERDGYWFFRGVIDKDAVAQTRAEFLRILDELGVIDPSHTEAAVYNGAPLEDFPIKMGGDPTKDPLLKRYPLDLLVEHPKVNAFFEELLGEEVFWVPNSEFHAAPPGRAQGSENFAYISGPKVNSRFNYVHDDGANNKGLPLRVCWFPLAHIDEETGGLAITEGLHRPRLGDFPRPSVGVKEADVPADSWRRAIWEPGDVVIFSLQTVHSGLANLSDRYFRLSVDARCMPKSGNVPVIGTLAAVDANAIKVVDKEGKEHLFRLDADTFYRVYRPQYMGLPVPLEDIPNLAQPGDKVYVAHDHGTAVFVRPQH